MTLNIYALGQQIQIIRKKKGLSQNALSEMVDKSPTYLSYIETGSKRMSMDTFVDIVNALNTTADELLKDSLKNTTFITNTGFAVILDDCTAYEQRVLYDLLASCKQILRTNKSSFSSGQR